MKAGGADGLIVSDTPPNTTNSRTIANLASQFRLPAIYPYREYTVMAVCLPTPSNSRKRTVSRRVR
jgi:hypothetical protein